MEAAKGAVNGDLKNTHGKWGDRNPKDAGTNTSGSEKQTGKWVMNCKSC